MGALLKLSKLIDSVNEWIGKLTMWLVLAAVIISAGNATLRKAFNIGSNAWLEIQWYLFGAVFMLGVGYVMLKNAHVRIDFISGKLSKRTNAIIDAVGIVVFTIPLAIIMIDLGWPMFERAWTTGEMSQNAGGLIRWPAWALLPLGFAILLLQALSELIKRIAFITGHRDEPFSVEEGKSEEEFLKANIDAKMPPPAEAEIAKVFEENKAQMPPGSTLESMRPQIIGFLQQDQKRTVAMKLFSELRAKAQVQVLLSEPRVTVEAKGPSKGAATAKVTIVEFSDFQCPFCSKAEPSVDEVMKNYSDKVKVVFRHFPLDFHDKAFKASEAAACADAQGKFWEFHKTLFANQGALAIEDLKTHAKTLGLDTAKFNACLDGGKMKATVDADMAAAKAVGVNGTPAFFINGVMLSGAQPFEKFKEIIDAELAR